MFDNIQIANWTAVKSFDRPGAFNPAEDIKQTVFFYNNIAFQHDLRIAAGDVLVIVPASGPACNRIDHNGSLNCYSHSIRYGQSPV